MVSSWQRSHSSPAGEQCAQQVLQGQRAVRTQQVLAASEMSDHHAAIKQQTTTGDGHDRDWPLL